MLNYSNHNFFTLTDITSSESNFKRLSNILVEISKQNLINEKDLFSIFNNYNITYPKVIGRHIHIMKITNLLEKKENKYNITSEGKVIAYYSQNKDILTKEEKCIYFQQFFKNIYPQLFCVLDIIENNIETMFKWLENLEIISDNKKFKLI